MHILIGSGCADELKQLFASAERQIEIVMYQWTISRADPPHAMQQLTIQLQRALLRGVRVRVLLHTGNASDKLRGVNGRAEKELRSAGAQVKRWHTRQTLHAKLALVDGTTAVLGSHNFSLRSMAQNIEISALIEDAAAVRDLQYYFELLWGQV